jgi:nucleoid-associated protein YgaU
VGQAQAAGQSVDDATLFLRKAEQAAAEGDDERAATLADQARQAVAARDAIDQARPVVEQAVAEAGPLASDALKILDAAEAALKAGDPVRASELAAQARRQAETAVEQKKAEQAQLAAERARGYLVEPGDSLWGIAGKRAVYGDSRYWPLLLRSNRNRIRDADLIYPGQRLAVERSPAPADISAATRHARERRAWKVGPVEPADRAYLGE